LAGAPAFARPADIHGAFVIPVIRIAPQNPDIASSQQHSTIEHGGNR